MHFILRIIPVLLFGSLFLPGRTLHAQEGRGTATMLIGPTVSLNLEQMNTSVPAFSGSLNCGEFTSGWSYGPSLGIHIASPSLFAEKVGLAGQVQINALSGRYSTPAPEPFIIYNNAEAAPGEAAHEYRLNFRTLNARLNILLDFALTERIHFTAGPSLGLRFGTTLNQTDYITDDDYRFSGGKREIGMSTRTDLQPMPVVFGALFGASYQYTLNEELLFAPQMFLRTEFTPLFDGTTQFTASAGAGVMILTSLFHVPPSPPDPARIPPAPRTPRTPLSAFISVKSLDEDGSPEETAHIRLYETHTLDHPQTGWEVSTESRPPTLLIQPYYASSDGIRDWRVRFLCRGEILGVATSENPQALSRIDWRVASNSGIAPKQLNIELHVTDSTDATIVARDSIPLEVKRYARIIERREKRTLYSLYPVEENEDILTEENRKILESIADLTNRNDSILILRAESGTSQKQFANRTEEELRRMLQPTDPDISIRQSDIHNEELLQFPIQQTARPQILIVLERAVH